MPGSNDMQAREAHEARAGWWAMCRLIDKVSRGDRPDVIPPTVMVRQGETQYGALVAEAQAFFSTTVEYNTGGYGVSGGLLFVAAGMAAGAVRDSNAKRRAEAESMAQWRPLGRLSVAVTDQRLLLMIEGTWSVYHLRDLVSLQPELPHWALVLNFDGKPPLRLRGPWVPWLTVVITSIAFGRPWPNGFPPPIVIGAAQQPMMSSSGSGSGSPQTGQQPAVGAGSQPQPQPQPQAQPNNQIRDGIPVQAPPPQAPARPDAAQQDHIQRLRQQGG